MQGTDYQEQSTAVDSKEVLDSHESLSGDLPAPTEERPTTAKVALQRRAAAQKRRRQRLVLWIVIVAAVGASAIWFTLFADTTTDVSYRFATVVRGGIDRVVTATGELDAVTTVQVGTQVSGSLAEIHADFNDEVVTGQVLAEIDPRLLEAAVQEGEAALARNLAQLSHAQSEHERSKQLWDDDLTSRVQYETTQYALEVAEQSVTSAEIALERARQNLSYATIYAPISGTVIERNVDVGQTVAASLSAPQLFLIAADLSRMQILVSVDESDIGLVEAGQIARFSVQAYRDSNFEGVVRQVRLQSSTQESVVTYTVVVDVDNTDRRLLPGMTATVDFIVESADDVLQVPNAALRFTPAETTDVARGTSSGGAAGGDDVRLWWMNSEGALQPVLVATGITDGQHTEVQGATLEAGMQIVIGVNEQSQAVTVNPFQSGGGDAPPPRGGIG
jgi:HlyD family secretion protein